MAESGESSRGTLRRVGQTLGKYRVERVLGSGGMATVFLAIHRNGHKVALKILSPELAADEDIRTRFVREGYAANSIDHPGVVRVIDDDLDEDGTPFLVMEFLEGETLQSRVTRSGGTLPAREVLALAHQLLDVLAAAHARGTIHRDLKPENLFLTRDGTLKVLDFGIARVVMPQSGSDPTRTGRAMGTPAFMAPEQAFGKTHEVDARTDLWSVGATMFTLLSGHHVHDAENSAQLVVLAATRPARPLRSVAPQVPEPVAAIVDRACAFDRDRRWDDARSMQSAVAEAYRKLTGSAVAAARVSGAASSSAAIESAPTLDAQSGVPRAPTPRTDASPVTSSAPGPRPRPTGALVVGGLAVAALAIGAVIATRHPASPGPSPAASAAASSAAPGSCTSSEACAAGAVCRAGACVALESVDCAIVARPEDVHSDSTVWIGAMFPRQGPMAVEFDGSLRDMEVARRDFMEVGNGLPPARPGAAPRPIGLVLCDDAASADRAARHLVDDLKMPAVIGFSRSKEVMDLATALFNPRRVLALASNTSAMLASIPPPPGEPRMVWRTTVSSSMSVPVDTALVGDVFEPELRAHGLPASEPLRVAFINVDNTTGVSVADAVVASLRFNGKSASDNGESFRQIVSVDGRPAGEEAARLARELAAFRPHVVMDAATNGEIIWALEPLWQGSPRPRYLVSAIGDMAPDGRKLADSIAGRVLDVDPGMQGSAQAKFALRYGVVFDRKTNPTHAETGAPYDAFYALAYAMVALGDAPVTGPALARALGRLGSGPQLDVGPGAILEATAALARGESIDLQGTTTSLDFDPKTGDPTVELSIACARNGREGVVLTESGLHWDREARRVTGKLACK